MCNHDKKASGMAIMTQPDKLMGDFPEEGVTFTSHDLVQDANIIIARAIKDAAKELPNDPTR